MKTIILLLVLLFSSEIANGQIKNSDCDKFRGCRYVDSEMFEVFTEIENINSGYTLNCFESYCTFNLYIQNKSYELIGGDFDYMTESYFIINGEKHIPMLPSPDYENIKKSDNEYLEKIEIRLIDPDIFKNVASFEFFIEDYRFIVLGSNLDGINHTYKMIADHKN